ncbi:MAG: substrate-binding protein [Rhizobiaceae bacterium]|nr:substrate-binding protein [Rhizobiaceae bacterium]
MDKRIRTGERFSRRRLLKVGAGAAAAGILAPYIARAAEPIRVGVLQPFSGGLEVLGMQGAQGAELAMLEANEAGGVLDGRMFEFIRADDKTDPKTAVERTTELLRRDNVTAIIGPVTSANRDAMMPTIQRSKSLLLYATDYEGGVCVPNVACYSALPEQWINPLVPYALENLGKSFYLIGSDYVWPQKMNAAFRTQAESAGGKIVGEEYSPWGAKDYAATLRKIESAGTEVVVTTLVGADAITFVKQFAAAGLNKKLKIVFLGFSENYLGGLSSEESEGIVTVSNFIETLDKPEAKEFVAKVKARYGDTAIASNTVDAHYTLTRLFIDGIKRANSVDPTAIMENMVGQPIMSGNGEVVLRPEDRHAVLNVLIAQVQDGKLAVKKDLGRIEGPNQCG